MPFTADQRERLAGLWDRMLAQPFLIHTREGTISDDTFARWMRQDYLFVEQGVHFLAMLLARAPKRHRDPLGDALDGLRNELRLFEEQAKRAGVVLADTRPPFVTHAYMQFLAASGVSASYTVLYVAERAYHDSWSVVRDGINSRSKVAAICRELGGGTLRKLRRLPRERARRVSSRGWHRRTHSDGGTIRVDNPLRGRLLGHGSER